MDAKTRAAASIAQAKADLDNALLEIDSIRTVDPSMVGLVAHALGNYISVTAATVEMLQLTLRDYPDPDVAMWIDGIGHAADLMQHSVGRLVAASPPRDFVVKMEHVNLGLMMERTCQYHRRRADARQVRITCRVVGHVPLVWADRVALAMIADDLVSNAVASSAQQGTVHVQVMCEPGFVVCSIRDEGAGATGKGREETRDVAVAEEFVRRMNGTIWSEQEGARGACVSFRVPACQ
jgi:signal transduction histidine kinase